MTRGSAKYSIVKIISWAALVLLGTASLAIIGLHRGETINSIWFITSSICIYLIFYRFYAAFIAAKVLMINENNQTPAFKFKDGKDFEPTNKWILFGHHFAAIAGPGPLIGPTLAAQFGYLPGILWILVGSVLGGCVQDMVILFYSVRRGAKSLSQMAKDELGKIGGTAAMLGTLIIMIILISVLGLIVVNAMKHSAWAGFTVFVTIPIAILIGIYMRYIRPGAVFEASLIGLILLILAVIFGRLVQESELLRPLFDHDALTLFWAIVIYGFTAAILPIWLLLAPRDYISTFVKLGTIFLLGITIIILRPEIKMPAFTQFIDGHGPIFGGKIFPFLFITIACGAISGFHSLIASGTTPKLITNEKYIPMIGYGAMALESFVAVMALIAATIMEPGIFFAINSPIAAVGSATADIVSTINGWGFKLTITQMDELARQVGETTLFNRTGGGPSLAVGMAGIFGNAFGQHLLAIWYHFIIMFEAIFILTTLDAGTRVCRFMLQDIIGNVYKPLGRISWYPGVLITSFIVVVSWGYFLYAGIIDPNGGINMLWPLFGMANQILAAIALSVATCILIKSDKIKYFWITTIPLCWLSLSTLTAAYQKIFSNDIRIGAIATAKNIKYNLENNLLPESQIKIASTLIFNQYVVAALTAFFAIVLIIILFDIILIAIKILRKNQQKTSMNFISLALRAPPKNKIFVDTNTHLKMNICIKYLNFIIEKLSGNYEYKKYLTHHKATHHGRKHLSKKEFFEKKEQDKWKEINTCC